MMKPKAQCENCVFYCGRKCSYGAPQIYKDLGLVGPVMRKNDVCGQHKRRKDESRNEVRRAVAVA